MTAVSAVKNFLVQKFWRPVANESVYYNPFNTAVYSVLFAAAAAYVGKPLLERLQVDLDREFFLSIAPYVFLGGATRSLKDANIVNTILLETPFIYVVFFIFTAGLLALSQKLEDILETSYYRVFGATGSISLIAVLSLYRFENPFVFTDVALIFVPISALIYFGTSLTDLENYVFSLPVIAHMFDASTSFVALGRGATEKHVLANYFIDLMGASGMFVMKSLVVIPATYYICTEIDGKDRNYYLFLVATLGFALGTRNLISTAA